MTGLVWLFFLTVGLLGVLYLGERHEKRRRIEYARAAVRHARVCAEANADEAARRA